MTLAVGVALKHHHRGRQKDGCRPFETSANSCCDLWIRPQWVIQEAFSAIATMVATRAKYPISVAAAATAGCSESVENFNGFGVQAVRRVLRRSRMEHATLRAAPFKCWRRSPFTVKYSPGACSLAKLGRAPGERVCAG